MNTDIACQDILQNILPDYLRKRLSVIESLEEIKKLIQHINEISHMIIHDLGDVSLINWRNNADIIIDEWISLHSKLF